MLSIKKREKRKKEILLEGKHSSEKQESGCAEAMMNLNYLDSRTKIRDLQVLPLLWKH